MNIRKSIAVLSLLSLFCFLLSNCRSRPKATALPSSLQEIQIRLINMQDADLGNASLRYEVGGCTEGAVQGKMIDDSLVSFAATGISTGSVCSLRVLYPMAPQASFQFLDQKELMYFAPRVPLSISSSGKWTGTAVLSKTYNIQNQKIPTPPSSGDPTPTRPIVPDLMPALARVAVSFPLDQNTNNEQMMGQLVCEPAIPYISKIQWAGAREGSFVFEVPTKQQGTPLTCSKIHVFDQNIWSYTGVLGAGSSGGFKFTATSGATSDLSGASTIRLEKLGSLAQTTGLGISVQIKGTANCPDGEVFDIKTRTCVKP